MLYQLLFTIAMPTACWMRLLGLQPCVRSLAEHSSADLQAAPPLSYHGRSPCLRQPPAAPPSASHAGLCLTDTSILSGSPQAALQR